MREKSLLARALRLVYFLMRSPNHWVNLIKNGHETLDDTWNLFYLRNCDHWLWDEISKWEWYTFSIEILGSCDQCDCCTYSQPLHKNWVYVSHSHSITHFFEYYNHALFSIFYRVLSLIVDCESTINHTQHSYI